MADTKSTEAKPDEKAEKAKAEPRKLGRASESGDAGIQNLLGQRSIHASNGDDARVKEIDDTLADLGYAV